MQFASEIISLIVGAIGGSLVTWNVVKKSASNGGTVVDQSGSSSTGDMVGGNKTERK